MKQEKELIFKKNEIEYMKLCIDITVYWLGSAFNHVAGILSFYNQVLEMIGDKLLHYETEEMAGAEKINAEILERLPNWLRVKNNSKDIFTLTLESNSIANLPSDLAFDFWAVEYPEKPAGAIRLILPRAFIVETPQSLINLGKNLVKDLNFHSGHIGYSINWDHRGDYATSALKKMGVISRRFPGIDLPNIACTLIALPDGIKRVNWLTLVGKSIIQSLIESTTLSQIENSECSVDELPHGYLIKAGSEPKVGDVNRQESLENYHRVGHLIASIRSENHPPFLPNVSGFVEDEITEDWLAYFD